MGDPFSPSRVLKIDSRNVHATYSEWPSLARKGFEISFELPREGLRKAYVLGMGGSASGGDVIASWLTGRKGVETGVFKGQMPIGDMRDTLAIACSVSGETEETIRMMRIAVARGATVVSMSAGGTLRSQAAKLGIPHVQMPRVVAPRYMLPFIIFSSLAVLNRGLGLRCESQASEAFREMDRTEEIIRLKTKTAENPSKKLALLMLHKTPVVYAARITRGAGVRFKNVLNENAKKHALFDGLPDAFHNDIESWEEQTKDFLPLFLRHSEEEPRDGRRTTAMVRILRRLGMGPVEMRGSGKSSLAQLVTMVFKLDLVSYYVAIGLGRDPFPVRLIDSLKRFP